MSSDQAISPIKEPRSIFESSVTRVAMRPPAGSKSKPVKLAEIVEKMNRENDAG